MMGTVQGLAIFFLGLFSVLTLVVLGMTIYHAVHHNLVGSLIGVGFTLAAGSNIFRFAKLVQKLNRERADWIT